MDDEKLPYWAYGPMPRPLAGLLLDNDDLLKDQLNTHAHERVTLINECLQNFLLQQKQRHTELVQKLKDLNEHV